VSDLANQLAASFDSGSSMFLLQTGDIKQADAVRRARGNEGASIAWIGGHLLSFRGYALAGCGARGDDPWAAMFSMQTPATDGADHPTPSAMRDAWVEVHDRLRRAVLGLSDEQLNAASPMFGGSQSLLDVLRFCASHEAYHLGALGLLRVLWGYRHTHVLAMEAKGMKID
jgi:hypothetical protein